MQKKHDLDKSNVAKGPIRVQCPNCKRVWVVRAEFKHLGTKVSGKEKAVEDSKVAPAVRSTLTRLLPIEDLITIRAVVGFLGEKPQFEWWDTNFLSDIGLKYLNIIFPRTYFSAGLNSVTEAAKRLHDNRIGKGGLYHLFRMPEFVEHRIARRLFDFNSSVLLTYIKNKETALEHLQSMVGSSVKTGEGPIQIGTGKNLTQLSYIRRIAKHYADAFENGIETFPYFMES